MPKTNLTSRFVRKATCPPDRLRIDYFDDALPGFSLEVRASGGKTYYQRYVDALGHKRQYKIGPALTTPLAAARRMAREIIAQGGDGHQTRKYERRQVPTLSEFVRDQYLPHVAIYKRSLATDISLLDVHILPAFGSSRLNEITPERIGKFIQALQQRGYRGASINRIRALFRFMFNLARKWKVPGSDVNPTLDFQRSEERKVERYLDKAERKRLFAALDADKNQVTANFIRLLLLTGARRSELSNARWDCLDLKLQTLMVPRSKSGKARWITLSGDAVKLLGAIKRQAMSPLMFPDHRVQSRSAFYFEWHRVRLRAKIPDVRLHDLRHSFASILVNKGASLYLVQKLLGHTNPVTTQRYSHLSTKTLIDGAELVAGILQDGENKMDKEPT